MWGLVVTRFFLQRLPTQRWLSDLKLYTVNMRISLRKTLIPQTSVMTRFKGSLNFMAHPPTYLYYNWRMGFLKGKQKRLWEQNDKNNLQVYQISSHWSSICVPCAFPSSSNWYKNFLSGFHVRISLNENYTGLYMTTKFKLFCVVIKR